MCFIKVFTEVEVLADDSPLCFSAAALVHFRRAGALSIPFLTHGKLAQAPTPNQLRAARRSVTSRHDYSWHDYPRPIDLHLAMQNEYTERKRLTKRAPHSQSSDRTQQTLYRTLSATGPLRSRSNSNTQQYHHRSPTLPSPGASSQTSIDSTLASSAARASRSYQDPYTAPAGQYHLEPRFSVTEKTSTDLLGQRFDSAAILSNLNAVSYPADPQSLQPQAPPQLIQQYSDITAARPTQARPPNPAASSTTLANPDVRLSQSLAATGRRMDQIAPPRGDLGARSPRQRLSDEVKEGKLLKKKSGFSSFMNNLVGTKGRPAISAPENPVHVTHVGYDTETGEFTVRHDLWF